jgi:hypothetical protein
MARKRPGTFGLSRDGKRVGGEDFLRGLVERVLQAGWPMSQRAATRWDAISARWVLYEMDRLDISTKSRSMM